jgi:hypothetical protein
MPRPPKQIPIDSVFAHLRDLPRVGQAALPEDPEWEPEIKTYDYAKMVEPIPADNKLRRYFAFGQNDAHVIGGTLSGDRFTLTLNHYDVWRLACSARILDWWDARRCFPVSLHFEGLKEIYAMRSAEDQHWQLIRNSRSRMFSNFWDVICFTMHSWADDEVVAALRVNNWRPFTRRQARSSNYSNWTEIHIRAKNVSLDESYRDGWIKHCGKATLPLLDAFEDVWPVQEWGVAEFERWAKLHGHEFGVNFEESHDCLRAYSG